MMLIFNVYGLVGLATSFFLAKVPFFAYSNIKRDLGI